MFTPQNWHFDMGGILIFPNPIQICLPISSLYSQERCGMIRIIFLYFILFGLWWFTGSWNSPAGRQSPLTPMNPNDSDGTQRSSSCKIRYICSNTWAKTQYREAGPKFLIHNAINKICDCLPDKDFMGNDVLSEILGNLLFTTLEDSQWFFSKATDVLVCLKWTGLQQGKRLY